MEVKDFYSKIANEYEILYNPNKLYDLSCRYPANYFRLQMLLNSFKKHNLNKIIEIGVGEGTPLCNLYKMGFDVCGFDISEEMVERALNNAKSFGIDTNKIFCADIQDPISYISKTPNDFDGLIAMGVMPHVDKEEFVLKNMNGLLKSGGRVFIEFRNKIFSLFTFNKHTVDFITNDLLKDVDRVLVKEVENQLSKILSVVNKEKKDMFYNYNNIMAKFHNPFEISKTFEECGFKDINLLWYHYHAAPPFVSSFDEQLFREESIKMENNTFDWRSPFLCSAFVVEAVKI